jgi:protein phosphatase
VIINSAALTDVGRKREHNEDNFFYGKEYNLFCVADGMGGAAAGEVASEIVAGTMKECAAKDLGNLKCTDSEFPSKAQEILSRTIKEANQRIQNEVALSPAKAGMGSTCVAACFDEGRIHFAHVGDSRIYRLRNKILTQLTEDHSWVNESVKQGVITPEEAINHKFKNIITRAVGTKAQVEVDTQTQGIMAGDVFFLCSDGVQAGNVSDNDLQEIMTRHHDNPQEIVKNVIDLANKGGGPDNITCIAVLIKDTKERTELLKSEIKKQGTSLIYLIAVFFLLIAAGILVFIFSADNNIEPPRALEYPGHTNSGEILLKGSNNPENKNQIIIDNQVFTAETDKNGLWQIILPCKNEKTYSVTLKSINPKGKISSESSNFIFTVDRTAPKDLNITYPPENSCISSSNLTIKGETEKNCKIIINIPPDDTYETIADDNGFFSTNTDISSLSDGHHQILITVIDPALNKSKPFPHTFEIDRTGPDKPQIIFPVKNMPVRTVNFNLKVLSKNSEKVFAALDGNKEIEAKRENNSDIFSLEIKDLKDMSQHTLKVNAFDRAGNKNSEHAGLTFTVATKLPPHPVITWPKNDFSTNSGFTLKGTLDLNENLISTDQITNKENNFEKKESQIIVFMDQNEYCTVSPDEKGLWSAQISFQTEGVMSISARNRQNNLVSGPSNIINVTFDKTWPDHPVIAEGPGIYTNSKSYNLKGLSEPQAQLTLFDSENKELSQTPADQNGNFIFNDIKLNENKNKFFLSVKDSSGNINPQNMTLYIILDTQPPSKPLLDSIPRISDKKNLIIKGRGEENTSLFYLVKSAAGKNRRGETPVNPNGIIEPVELNLETGNYSLIYWLLDKSGNESIRLTTTFQIIPNMPQMPALDIKNSYIQGTNSNYLFTGNALAGHMVAIEINGDTPKTGLCSSDNTFKINAPLEKGENKVKCWSYLPDDPECKSRILSKTLNFSIDSAQNSINGSNAGDNSNSSVNTPANNGKTPLFAPVDTALKQKLTQTDQTGTIKIPNPSKMVNINTASAREMAEGLDIPLKIAEKIFNYRTKNGAFKNPSETIFIPGMDKDYENNYYGYIRHCIKTRSDN